MIINPSTKKITLEPYEEQFIKDNFHRMTNSEIAEALDLKVSKLRGFAYNMGLKRMELQYWTDEQVSFLKENYKQMGDTELTEIFEVKWYKEKGWKKGQIEKKRRYLNLKRTLAQREKIKKRNTLMGRFKGGANKRWEVTGVTPEGEKRIWYNHDNRPFVVIRLKSGFVHYNPWLWEQYYGKPPKGYVVRNFSDNLLDVSISDLKLVTRAQNAALNSRNRLPPELQQTKKLINKLSRAIKNQEKNE